MTRRKQHCPQRLKSDDESEDDSPKGALSNSPSSPSSSLSSSADLANTEEEDKQSMADNQSNDEKQIGEEFNDEEGKETDVELDANDKVTEDTTKPASPIPSSIGDENPVNVVEKNIPTMPTEDNVTNKEVETQVKNSDGITGVDKVADTAEDISVGIDHAKTTDTHMGEKNRNRTIENIDAEVGDNNFDTINSNTDLKETNVNSDKDRVSDDPVEGKDAVKKSKKLSESYCDDQNKKGKEKTKHSNATSSHKKKMKFDAESPISKLLNMVNNPEKIQSKTTYSNSFSLAASSSTSHKVPVSQNLKQQTPVVSNSINNSNSQLRSSKPLSGFLSPYGMYPQLQSMYATMPQLTNQDEITEESKKHHGTLKIQTPSSPSLQSSPLKKFERYNSSPLPKSSNIDEQPLDLSVKSKGLDLTLKAKSELDNKRKSSGKNIPASSLESNSSNEVSSLKSLEEKFGGNPFKLDKSPMAGGPKHFIPYLHPMLPMYGGALYTPALFSTHPWMHTEKLPRSDMSPRKFTNSGSANSSSSNNITSPSKHMVNSHNTSEKRPSNNTKPFNKHSSSSHIGSDNNAHKIASLSTSEKDNCYNKKYTNLKCSCKKEFETLYQLTLHLKQTGHTPSTKISGQQDFPKLVRGQDMWLNHGSEQTKQILRCIRCGESFKSLPELTVHMMKTKHYANIVGAESSSRGKIHGQHNIPGDLINEMDIYKCFQCEKSFSGMEDFSKHMLTSGHHKSPIVIQPMSPGLISPCSERSSPREQTSTHEPSPKRCKIENETPSTGNVHSSKYKPELSSDKDDDTSWDSFSGEDNKIRCETCGDKIEMSKFVEHVRQCIRNSSWDSTAPLKKRRFEYADKDKTLSSESCDRFYNGRNTPNSPTSVDSSSKEQLIQPSENSNDSSALKAMETFIERSFIPSKKDKPNMFGYGGPLSHSVFPMPYVNGHSPKSPSISGTAPTTTSHTSSLMSLYTKYLPPLYLPPSTADDLKTDKSESKTIKSENKLIPKDFSSISTPACTDNNKNVKTITKTENNNHEILPTKFLPVGSDISDHDEKNNCVSPNSLREKYLNVDTENKEIDHGQIASPTNVISTESKTQQSNISALASLQGLVYGKSFQSKHPLDNLQKLIHKNRDSRDSPSLASIMDRGEETMAIMNGNIADNKHHSNNIVKDLSSSTFHPLPPLPMPQSALTKCSIPPSGFVSPVDSTGGGFSCPDSPCKSDISTATSPAPGSHTSAENRGPSPAYSSENDTSSKTGGLSEGELDKNVDSPSGGGDYVCGACSRSFASSGAYRYHNSRCHVTKAKKYDCSKENINKTPYVYLPLDHSAKFNKYYEMANELANKTK